MPFGKGAHRLEVVLERKVRRGGYAGLVVSKQFPGTIGIVVREDLLDEMNVQSVYITAKKDGSDPRIILSMETLVGIKRGCIADRFSLLHEVGHYICGHLVDPPDIEEELAMRERLLEENQVSQDEVEADAFAVNYLGAEAVVWALQESMERRMTADLVYGVEEEDISQKALLEYQLRIDAINDRFGLGE
jgi:hypothetical protein